jgi:hypothetical protein
MKKVLVYCLLIFGIHFQVFSQEPSRPFLQVSAFYFHLNYTQTAYIHAGYLWKTKRESWKNEIRADVQLYSLSPVNDEMMTLQYGKAYRFTKSHFVWNANAAVGPYLYMNNTASQVRNFGLSVGLGSDLGYSFKKFDLTGGIVGCLGYGKYEINLDYGSENKEFAFSLILSPYIRMTFKK